MLFGKPVPTVPDHAPADRRLKRGPEFAMIRMWNWDRKLAGELDDAG